VLKVLMVHKVLKVLKVLVFQRVVLLVKYLQK